jgi:hypothetical protein
MEARRVELKLTFLEDGNTSRLVCPRS